MGQGHAYAPGRTSMRVCELCGKELPNQESFCRHCGRTADHGQETSTSISVGNTAIVQGTPQFGSVPSVHGSPQMAGDPFVQNPTQGGYPSSAFHSSPTIAVPRYAPSSAPPYAPGHPPIIHGAHYPPHRPPLPYHPHSPYHTAPGGCAPLWLIFLFASIIIISSMISIGLTVLSPSLSLSGGTDVALGDSLHLHGSGFIPVSGVILTLDDTTPLCFTYRSSPLQASYATHTMIILALATVHRGQISSSNNIVVVGIDGSFNVTITIDPSWHTGQHTILASERTFPRSALITINVHQPAQIPTSSSSLVASPSSTPSVNPSPTASPSTTPSGLSCLNPTLIAPGPVRK